MNRRIFLFILPLLLGSDRKLNSYRFKIKTKSGSIVNNVVIQAYGLDAAKVKLNKKYPDCIVLESSEN